MVQTRRCSFSVPSLPSPSSRSGKNIVISADGAKNVKRRPLETTNTPKLPPRPSRIPNCSSSVHPSLAVPDSSRNKSSDVKVSALVCEPSEATESESTPADHFLHGFNIDNCSDLLSIPDPPSPELRWKRNKRRESSPLLRPLQELTNKVSIEGLEKKRPRKSFSTLQSAQNLVDASDELKRDEAEKASNADQKNITKRLRKMVSNVSYPVSQLCNTMEYEMNAIVVIPSLRQPKVQADNELQMKDLELPAHQKESNEEIFMDDSADFKRKPQTKRMSMLLPSDIYSDDHSGDNSAELIAANEYFQRLMNYKDPLPSKDNSYQLNRFKGVTFHEQNPVTAIALSTEITMQHGRSKLSSEMEIIRDFSRGYCSLSIFERDTSLEAREIERLTGYSLVPPSLKRRQALKTAKSPDGFDCISSCSNEILCTEERRAIILTMDPIMKLLDVRKHEELALLEKVTDCRVEKSRNNKHRYIHIPTGKRINPMEYKLRYLHALSSMKRDIRVSVRSFLDQYEEANKAPSDDIACGAVANGAVEVEPANLVRSGRLEGIGEDGFKKVEEEGTFGLTMKEVNFPTVTEMKESYEQFGQSTMAQARDANLTRQLLLPLPARDETSSDPNIAAAEANLWSAIDAALAIYSNEVLSIRASKVSVPANT